MGKISSSKDRRGTRFSFLIETNFKRQNMWNIVLKTLEVRQQSKAIQAEKKKPTNKTNPTIFPLYCLEFSGYSKEGENPGRCQECP